MTKSGESKSVERALVKVPQLPSKVFELSSASDKDRPGSRTDVSKKAVPKKSLTLGRRSPLTAKDKAAKTQRVFL